MLGAGFCDDRYMATTEDHLLAAELAMRSGVLLVKLQSHLSAKGISAPKLGSEGDRASHNFLVDALAEARPKDAVLSEEGSPHDIHPDRMETSRVWIIDPLDGTKEFNDPRRNDWAIHVALAEEGQPTAGAVALPGLGLTFSTHQVNSTNDFEPVPIVPRIVVSQNRPPDIAQGVSENLGAQLIRMGSAGAKAMAVVKGETDIYLHDGGQYEWDSCAPVAVADSVGLHVSRVDGSPLRYNQSDPFLPDLLICRKELANKALDAIAKARNKRNGHKA